MSIDLVSTNYTDSLTTSTVTVVGSQVVPPAGSEVATIQAAPGTGTGTVSITHLFGSSPTVSMLAIPIPAMLIAIMGKQYTKTPLCCFVVVVAVIIVDVTA